MKKLCLIVTTIVSLFILGCDNPDFLNDEIKNDEKNRFLLSESEMIQIAEVTFRCNANLKSSDFSKEVSGYKLIVEDDRPCYYVVNYLGGGFIILSADKRGEPLLAYSYKSYFPLNENEMPDGLLQWKEATIEDIIQLGNQESIDDYTLERWEKALKDGVPSILPTEDDPSNEIGEEVPENPNDPACNTKTYSVSPLLSTAWHQGVGFNNEAPYMDCTQRGNGRAAAGCVAIAGAQVINYFKYPTAYDYSLMYNTTGSSEASRLVHDVGNAVNMDYGCSGSNATTKDLVNAFIYDFSYSSASYGNFNPTIIRNELNWGYPVILRGESSAGGHAWVCDGYDYYVNPCGSNLLWLHMNWGWGSGGYNGSYRVKDFRGFNSNNEMIYGIRK